LNEKKVAEAGLIKLKKTFSIAAGLARKHQRRITPDLLALALLDIQEIQTSLSKYVDVNALKQEYTNYFISQSEPDELIDELPNITNIIISQARSELKELSPTYLFNKIIKSHYAPLARGFFNAHGITAQLLDNQIDITSTERAGITDEELNKEQKLPSVQEVLGLYCTDLTALASTGKLQTVIGRDAEVHRVFVALNKPLHSRSAMLVGEIGVGKTAILRKVAHILASKECPVSFQGARLMEVDVNRIVGGAKFRGELEDRINVIIDAVRAGMGNTILFWNKMHRVSGEGNTNIAEMLMPSVLRGEIRVIGATTFSQFNKMTTTDPAIRQAFPPIMISEPNKSETISIVKGLADEYKEVSGVTFNDEVVEVATNLSIRFLTDEQNPAKTISLINSCCSQAQLLNRDTITVSEIMQMVEDLSGIPVSRLQRDELKKINDLNKALLQRVIGQKTAVTAVTRAVKRHRTGFADPNRPASFIFLGPTGVGKTHLAKMLALFVFDRESAMVRFDMSEFMSQMAVSKLVGAAPGYVGYEEGGQLTSAVQKNPYTVVLFDEVEKAHPDIFNILLQLLDDGRLTDGQGRLVNFKNTIVIMTSNIGSQYYGSSNAGEMILAEVKKFFRPEILNRIDEQIIFNQLTRRNIEQIVKLEIDHGIRARAAEKKIDINFSKQAINLLADLGFDPVYGARPIKRTLTNLVVDKLSDLYLSGELVEGNSVQVKSLNKNLQISIQSDVSNGQKIKK
jgi:ATP-dependent Clp protease ATP-binding subunit ClpC